MAQWRHNELLRWGPWVRIPHGTSICIIIIIIQPFTSPLLNIGLPQVMPQSTVLSHLHPSTSCMSHQVVTTHLVGGSFYTSPTSTRLPLKNLSSPSVVGSSSYMAGPLLLLLTNPLSYVGHSGSTADILISKFIMQRHP
ncbi:unnamed protein product [Parnassius mnemosyne]|uniref:Uncharacterized protein n=1 Tax=Parnassius mnemosyne TaxID=213953 RepID=A0AAV1LGB9_9NEOP